MEIYISIKLVEYLEKTERRRDIEPIDLDKSIIDYASNLMSVSSLSSGFIEKQICNATFKETNCFKFIMV